MHDTDLNLTTTNYAHLDEYTCIVSLLQECGETPSTIQNQRWWDGLAM